MEETRHYSFFQNRACEYFPCHPDVPQEEFNCLFCFCPLYALGRKCGGSCTYTEHDIKDCGNCSFPHHRENYPFILERYKDINDVVKLSDAQNDRT